MRASLALVLLLWGCDDVEGAGATGRSVDTLEQACQQRARASGDAACTSCRIVAQQAPCGCEHLQEGAGACLSQADARRAEASCTEALDACVSACKPGDCGCEEACYAGAEGCRKATLSLESCLSAACGQRCP